jgi:hypothetical protein
LERQNKTCISEFAKCFCTCTPKEEIGTFDEAVAALYGGGPHEGLDLLRFRKFASKVMSTSTFVEIHTLTTNAE